MKFVRKIFLIPLVFVGFAVAAGPGNGPLYQHEDSQVQREFINVYQDIKRVVTSSGTLQCIDNPTFCVDSVTNQIGIGGSVDKTNVPGAPIFIHAGTSTAVTYALIKMSFGSVTSSGYIKGQRTTGVTATGSYILAAPTDGIFLVAGNDLTNYFRDVIDTSYSVNPHLISTQTVVGTPASRSYTGDGTGIKLTMGSGTYSVAILGLDLERN